MKIGGGVVNKHWKEESKMLLFGLEKKYNKHKCLQNIDIIYTNSK
jgi:hypothetical protein